MLKDQYMEMVISWFVDSVFKIDNSGNRMLFQNSYILLFMDFRIESAALIQTYHISSI